MIRVMVIKFCLIILYLTSFISCADNKKVVKQELKMKFSQIKDFKRQKVDVKNLHKCAFEQDLDCARSLGSWYLFHENNIEEALFWYNLASIKGDYSASLNLGDLYVDGEYMKKNINLAKNYYYKSAVNGYGITIYVRFLKKYFPQNIKEINLWENIIYSLNDINTNNLDGIEKVLIANYVKNNQKSSQAVDLKKINLLLNLIRR